MKIDQLEGGISTAEVKHSIYCPELVPGIKTTVSARNFTFSVHVRSYLVVKLSTREMMLGIGGGELDQNMEDD